MITAVDTSVLLDIFADDATHRVQSVRAMRRCLAEGPVVASDVVWSEVVAGFPDARSAHAALAAIPVTFAPTDAAAATRAGVAWRTYRRRGGSRERLVADMLIGAHAIEQADRLLTRDRGFHGTAFADLVVVDPTRAG